MSTDLTGKVAIVTGGSRGIGAAVARRLAAEGARVFVVCRSRLEEAEALAATLGQGAQAMAADISVPSDCERLVGDCARIAGRLDILVNAAGLGPYRALEDADPDHYEAVFGTNVRGALCLTRAAVPAMTQGGRIVHFGSRLAETPMPGTAVYAASKAAVSAMVLALSQELGTRGITINAVAPGLIETEMTAETLGTRRADIEAATPLRRIGQPDDISGLVAFLVSAEAGWITGRTIRADGGLL
ncbi:SDR family NAD(P)-dependent oxidoreductase [Salipiger bermudensis]|uniref:SDR family NAD(P)-dependent oxidoreductase n=1 Tax=Salipiger bermudensis TaxID=344736 RepID=UPI001CD570F3|nr:glucose 1-dehydrogenase [Salipiger bermudensis]MCA0963057.1 glucose 1-dehydrogenase [Salipiger bermudensis]